VATVILAAIILSESPSPIQLVGVGLVVAALLAVGRAKQKAPVETTASLDVVSSAAGTAVDESSAQRLARR
jgi:hypothetical protein